MNATQIQQYVLRYLQATQCHIIEKSPAHLTVKFSPEADKALTNRPYYWNFVDRTGAEPETMTYTFIFDQAEYNEAELIKESKAASQPRVPQQPTSEQGNEGNSILARYFGSDVVPTRSGRIASEQITYGSHRLKQIYQSAHMKGKYLHLFEQPQQQLSRGVGSASYSSWLAVNYKVELACDMKREEIFSLGISLSTGEIIEDFHHILLQKDLVPRLPAHTHIRETITLQRALLHLENYVENEIRQYDHRWAEEAQARLQEELNRIETYYADLTLTVEEDKKQEVDEQFNNRKEEIAWQYQPRIQVSVINCGIFHLDDKSSHTL